ncbi:hypothetical protein [Granulicella tundricola]|uniref:hypothetical protein n=1 Tax=Granulicella tundricola TaxID=940615 RepID=UPI0001DB7439|nr:hypothetical protein [Granulicella tundricola]
MPIRYVNQILNSYSANGVTYNKGASGTGVTYNNPWQVLTASGDAVSAFTEPHITVWANNANRITTVEFTWAGSYHLEFRNSSGRIFAKHIPGSEATNAANLENHLIAFLQTSHIVGPNRNIGRAFAAPVANAAPIVQAPLNLNSLAEFPSLR